MVRQIAIAAAAGVVFLTSALSGAMPILTVNKIDDPTAEYRRPDLRKNKVLIYTDDATTVGDVRKKVTAEWGTPADRQRFYGQLKETNYGAKRYDTDVILTGDDGVPIMAALNDLHGRGVINSKNDIAVVLLSADGGAAPEEEKKRTTAGRATVPETDDSEGSVEDAGSRHPLNSRMKWAESVAARGEANDDDSGASLQDKMPPGERRAEAEADEGRTCPGDGAECEAEAASEQDGEGAWVNVDDITVQPSGRGVEDSAAASAGTKATGSAGLTLRSWLQGLGATGSNADRFVSYAAAFEREFNSLEDLALAADQDPEHYGGVEKILQACGVRTMGDKARIEWAIGKLPRPK